MSMDVPPPRPPEIPVMPDLPEGKLGMAVYELITRVGPGFYEAVSRASETAHIGAGIAEELAPEPALKITSGIVSLAALMVHAGAEKVAEPARDLEQFAAEFAEWGKRIADARTVDDFRAALASGDPERIDVVVEMVNERLPADVLLELEANAGEPGFTGAIIEAVIDVDAAPNDEHLTRFLKMADDSRERIIESLSDGNLRSALIDADLEKRTTTGEDPALFLARYGRA